LISVKNSPAIPPSQYHRATLESTTQEIHQRITEPASNIVVAQAISCETTWRLDAIYQSNQIVKDQLFPWSNQATNLAVSVASLVEGVGILGDQPVRVNCNFHFGHFVFRRSSIRRVLPLGLLPRAIAHR